MDVSRTLFTSQSSLDLPKASEWLANLEVADLK